MICNEEEMQESRGSMSPDVCEQPPARENLYERNAAQPVKMRNMFSHAAGAESQMRAYLCEAWHAVRVRPAWL